MLKKLTVLVVALAVLMVASVPALWIDSSWGLVWYDEFGNCYYDPDDVIVLYEYGNIPMSEDPCGGIVS